MAAATKGKGKRSSSRAKGKGSTRAKKSGCASKKSGSASRKAGSATKKAGSAGKKAGSAARKADVPDPVNRGANAAAAAAHAAKGTFGACDWLAHLASLARKPLIIGGAAIAGVAGGVALSKRAGR